MSQYLWNVEFLDNETGQIVTVQETAATWEAAAVQGWRNPEIKARGPNVYFQRCTRADGTDLPVTPEDDEAFDDLARRQQAARSS